VRNFVVAGMPRPPLQKDVGWSEAEGLWLHLRFGTRSEPSVLSRASNPLLASHYVGCCQAYSSAGARGDPQG
jgi:hypothetical protein